jgi:RNA polymerase-binding transcription factor DksA
MAAKSPTKKVAASTKPSAAAAPSKGSSKSKPAPAKATPAKQAASKQAASKKQPTTTKSSGTTKQASKRAPAPSPKASSKPATKPAAKPAAKPVAKQAAKKATAAPTKTPAPAGKPAPTPSTPKSTKPATDTMPQDSQIPKPKFSKEGLGYTKDFDLAFVKAQYDLLQQERVHLTGQAKRLEDEAHQLVEEAEMGDVQFDDEGGEGDTMVVERERDLALSAQARDAVAEIDTAIVRIMQGTYGYSVMSGRPIPKERLEAIPWSSVLVEEKVGGIGRR